jgi:hypothetical protein
MAGMGRELRTATCMIEIKSAIYLYRFTVPGRIRFAGIAGLQKPRVLAPRGLLSSHIRRQGSYSHRVLEVLLEDGKTCNSGS